MLYFSKFFIYLLKPISIMNKPQNSYESIKSDIKETGVSLFLVGGLILLVIILLSVIIGVGQSNLHIELKTLIICSLSVVTGLIFFNGKFRMWIVGGWLFLLAALPLLFILYIAISLIYYSITGQYLINPNIFAEK